MNGLNNSYKRAERPKEEDFKGFNCNIPQLKTHRISLYNGFFFNGDSEVEIIDKEIIICSLENARQNHSSLLATKGLLNSENETEGVFIYIPENVNMDIPLQILDIIKADMPLAIESKIIIILGRNSKLKLICCDDTVNNNMSISNNSLNIFIEDNAYLEYYKMENINNSSSIFTNTSFSMGAYSSLKTFWLSLNGGDIKNKLNVVFEKENANAELNGLYLVDKEQIVENEVFVSHNSSFCSSNQLYKGILDDSARAKFSGKVYVGKRAIGTIAMQNNRNLLLTDKARVNTQPFLEIYNDDVKCSHGATIGQLDENAMFYMRTRGISERIAKMLLMYAFCNDILLKSSIEALKERLHDIIQRRLNGELSSCENCILHCNAQCNNSGIDFSNFKK